MLKKLVLLGLFLGLAPTLASAQSGPFPAEWLGNWRGTLEIHKSQGAGSQYPMQLKISQLDSIKYRFALIYGQGDKIDERPYELLVIDAAKGHYRVDEKNSILIDAYLFGSRLITWFSVGPNVLTVSYEKIGETIVFEVTSSGDKANLVSGGQRHQAQDIPTVNSFLVNGFQRAVLRRE